MLPEDLAAHGEAQTCAPRTFRGDEKVENFRHRFRFHAGAVVADNDPHQLLLKIGLQKYLHCGIRPLLHGIQGVADDVEHGPGNSLRVKEQSGQIGGGRPANLRACLIRPVVDRLHDVGHQGHQIGGHWVGLPLLAEREHVHHERGDLVLIARDDIPALLKDCQIVVFQPHFHQIAAAADALQDVLDMV